MGGVTPTENPLPVSGFSGTTAVTTAWKWSSEDEFGSRLNLGAAASCLLRLSGETAPIADLEGNPLAETTIAFATADIRRR
ncbi:MAG: hypothetical protein R3E96_10205 [Planctomycetota bacterium]